MQLVREQKGDESFASHPMFLNGILAVVTITLIEILSCSISYRHHYREADTTEIVVGTSTIVIGEDPLAVTGADLPMTTAVGGTTIEGAATITVLRGEVPAAAHLPTTIRTMIPTDPLAHGVAIPTAHPAVGADPRSTFAAAVVAAIATAGTRAFPGSLYWFETSAHTSPVTILARHLDALVTFVMCTSQGITIRSRRRALPS